MAGATVSLNAPNYSVAWIRNPRFDVSLIIGAALIAIGSGVAILLRPDWYPYIIAVDMWLLGFHHVIATYTRLVFDVESLKRYWFFVFVLPVIVFGGTYLLYRIWGAMAIAMLYFHWQWFHYTRQSYGVERMFYRRSGRVGAGWLNKGVLYGVAAWGLAHRSFIGQETFLGADIKYLPVPQWVSIVLGGIFVSLFIVWLIRYLLQGEFRRRNLLHTAYVISHVLIFLVGYRLIPDVTTGWVVLNVWHNIQYLLVVWLFNVNRFKDGVDKKHRFLSTISQPRNALLYIVACMGITGIFYLGVEGVLEKVVITTLPITLLIFQGVNFHHYLVDGFIWKLRKKHIAGNLNAG